ncbi:helix-turn-helix domain-containing protein [Sinorhizobium meliloti]|uniref:helix-turn-helix domain-containing protein n=1 Tax=Rhizobium meliloti TaxID=382 RepID=UPI000FD92649|nr:helix-turn-helix domain-containing protein [Sinorhizobium meliloti]RVK13469.1 helix-turn-helix domain-containing protein [Sinorhizobium meliloti]
MARPEIEPKTALGARLREFRKKLGDPDRDEIAKRLGVSKNTLASYERGETEPTAAVMAAYRREFGGSLVWLVTGEGPIFDDPSSAPAPTEAFDVVLLQRIGDMVQATFVELKQTPPPRAITGEAGRLYNELLQMVADIRDEELVEAVLPVVRARFKKRLQEAAAEPGSGKRSAS